EGSLLAVRQKHRIVTEAAIPARRPYQRAANARFEVLGVAVWPCEAQRRDKMRPAAFWRGCAAQPQLLLDRFHGAVKIAIRTGPARRLNAGRAIERIDNKPRIIGERRKPRSRSGGRSFDARILAERHSIFARLGQSELTGRCGGYSVRRKQFAHFGKFA